MTDKQARVTNTVPSWQKKKMHHRRMLSIFIMDYMEATGLSQERERLGWPSGKWTV